MTGKQLSEVKKVQLKYGFSHNPTGLFYKDVWLCDYFFFNYNHFDSDENREVINIHLHAFDENFKNKEVLIPLDIIIQNRAYLYDEILIKHFDMTTDPVLRGKIRDYLLFIRFIDENRRIRRNDIAKVATYYQRKKLKENVNESTNPGK